MPEARFSISEAAPSDGIGVQLARPRAAARYKAESFILADREGSFVKSLSVRSTLDRILQILKGGGSLYVFMTCFFAPGMYMIATVTSETVKMFTGQ